MADGLDREATIQQVLSLQETVKGLLNRLQTVKSQYEVSQSENEMLAKYIQNLKSGSSSIRVADGSRSGTGQRRFTSKKTEGSNRLGNDPPGVASLTSLGTPGTGKTSMSDLLATSTSFKHINVGDLVKEHSLHEGWDNEYQCYIIDEDKVCDFLEDLMIGGGNIVDFHTVDFFPESWFDKIVVLRTDNTVLYPRLEERGYPDKKIQENVTAEIMETILCDALNSYSEDIVTQMQSNSIDEMEQNVELLQAWVADWIQARTINS